MESGLRLQEDAQWKRLWAYLIEPHPSLQGIEQSRQSRLLASITVVSILAFVAAFLSLLPLGKLTILDASTNLVSMGFSLVVYWLNRRGQYRVAAYLLTLGYFGVVHGVLLTEERLLLFYAGSVFILSGILLSLRATLLLVVSSLLLQGIVAVVNPVEFIIHVEDPLVFVIFTGWFILLSLNHRASVEQEQRAELLSANTALTRSEARWRLLVENAPFFIFEVDRAYKIRFINRIRSVVDPADVVGHLVYEFVEESYHDTIRAAIDEAFLTGRTVRYEVVGANEEGGQSWYASSVSPLGGMDSDHLIMVGQDITEEKKAEQQRLDLAIQNERIQMLEDVVSDLSHDIRSPLTAIASYAYLLRQQQSPEKQAELLDKLNDQIERAARLTEGLLSIAELDQWRDLPLIAVDLNELVRKVSQGHQEVAVGKGVTLSLDLIEGKVQVRANEAELSRVVANLLDNAINYTPSGGVVTVSNSLAGGETILAIEDNGIGIGAADLPHIFERFLRAEQARETSEGGTGLGLAIVKKIIDLHSGKIEVTSQSGKGSTFTIRLASFGKE